MVLKITNKTKAALQAKSKAAKKHFAHEVSMASIAASIPNTLLPDLQLVLRPIDTLKGSTKRARKSEKEQLERVAQSLKTFGQVAPVLINGTNRIINGHVVVAASKMLGLKEVWCVVVDHLDENETNLLHVTLNRIAELGDWDLEALAPMLVELEEIGLNGGVKGIAPASGGAGRSLGRDMPRPRKPANPFRYFHSSPEVIRLVVMMYIRFPLSLRNVEDLLFERGIDLCHETVRLWWNRFGPMFAADIRRQRVSRMRGFRQWKWHLDEVYVKINGEMHYLWRAVDHEGEVLESYVTKTRDKKAALTFIKKALKRHGRAEAIVTDGLKSYPAAMRELGNEERREMGRHANNRAENSHLPFRRRERAMQRFRQMKSLQKFASVHASIQNHFNQERHLVDRQTYKQRRSAALAEWQNVAA